MEVLYPYDDKWYKATVLTKTADHKLRVNYVGFNDDATINPVDGTIRKVKLMKGWAEMRDADSGDVYYLHCESGLTQWEKPTYQSESLRRKSVGRGQKIVNRVNLDEDTRKAPAPYTQVAHTRETDPHWREREFYRQSMSKSDKTEFETRRRSFAGSSQGGLQDTLRILKDQKKRRSSFSSVVTRSISSSALPIANYYHDQVQTNAKNRRGFKEAGGMGGAREAALGQR